MNECCKVSENRAPGFGPRGPWSEEVSPEGVTVTHCVVCGCRHAEVEADPLHIEIMGSGL